MTPTSRGDCRKASPRARMARKWWSSDTRSANGPSVPSRNRVASATRFSRQWHLGWSCRDSRLPAPSDNGAELSACAAASDSSVRGKARPTPARVARPASPDEHAALESRMGTHPVGGPQVLPVFDRCHGLQNIAALLARPNMASMQRRCRVLAGRPHRTVGSRFGPPEPPCAAYNAPARTQG